MKNELTAKRIQIALSNSNMKPQELADKSGVSKSSISQYVNGSHAPSNISSGKMGAVLGVNPLWLMGFDVDMKEKITKQTVNFENKAESYAQSDKNSVPPLSSSSSEEKLLMVFHSLNDDGQRKLIERAEELRDLGYIKGDIAKMA